ncbi:MAG TPA: NlpC/P60 family protein [Geomonas sp.]|nr:NlpC/P60 family protein [Geomonas sp.]
MRKTLFIVILSLFSPVFAFANDTPRYATAISPAPVLNTPDFHKFFSGGLKLDPCVGVRPVEFVALTGTLFRIEGKRQDHGITVYKVTSQDYPYPSKTGYFVDSRFVKELAGEPHERTRTLPELPVVQQRLLSALGKPYVWGGNVKDGVPLLRELYPQGDPLAGVDCSGLLYQATDGFTPRNTSALISFGKAVPVAGLSADQVARRLRPLDLIVWKGHVMIVLDDSSIIQSTMGCNGGESGVHVSEIKETLRHLMKRRQPVDVFPAKAAGAGSFVVRRWFPR